MKNLGKLLCLFMVFVANFSYAVPSCGRIQLNIKKAHRLWVKDPVKAQSRLKAAFNNAIGWTRNEYVKSVRERGFYLAVQCLSPELITEVSLAADTYLKLFPKGIYQREVLIRKALASFEENDWNMAEKALQKAEKLSPKRTSYSQKTLRFSGLLGEGKQRSAERYLEGSYLTKPSYRLKKDLRKFHLGNRYLAALMEKVKSGKLSPDQSVKEIEIALDNASFAKKASSLSIIATDLKDNKSPFYNPKEVEWGWKKRDNLHALAPQIRLARHQKFIRSFKEAPAKEIFAVLQKVRNIYLFETNEPEKAEIILNEMKQISGFKNLARVEELVSKLNGNYIVSAEGRENLKELLEYSKFFPYDNGALPVINYEDIQYLVCIADMVNGKEMTLPKAPEVNCYGGLPLDLFYKGALDKKMDAWKIYEDYQNQLSAPEKRMIEDCLYPLYLDTNPGECLFFAGLATQERFPYISIELIQEALSIKKRIRQNEHGLAVLASSYKERMAFEEAQEVWAMLRALHPDSIWLK